MTEQSNPSLVSKFKEGPFTYEQRLVDCGSTKCGKCTLPEGRRATHGPYWYVCVGIGTKWHRKYIGKHLDTTVHREHLSDLMRKHAQRDWIDEQESA